MHGQMHEKMACTKPRLNPVINIQPPTDFKRKRAHSRSTSPSAVDASAKRQKRDECRRVSADSEATLPKQEPNIANNACATEPPLPDDRRLTSSKAGTVLQHMPHASKPQSSMSRSPERTARARDKIESQINLEILIKHNELRLIEQELAKCQVALEQLRRCRLIPYPGQEESPISAEHVGSGTGPALEPSRGLSRPEQPAPWGVADGPYSRHYARWLIPDPKFDPSPPQPQPSTHSHGRKSIGGRSTRGSTADFALPNSRAPRGSTSSKLQNLNTSQAPKDPKAPLTATRPSDGRTVKLVCKFCGKDNISSMQGFLNHCRIQHKHEYSSHGAAAQDCGLLLDENEHTTVPPSAVELATPVSASTPVSNRPLVHPLVSAQPRMRGGSIAYQKLANLPSTFRRPTSRPTVQAHETGQISRPHSPRQRTEQAAPTARRSSSTPLTFAQGSFVASPRAPRLSALLEKRGVNVDFSALVDQAKDRSDIDNICEQLASDDEQEEFSSIVAKSAPSKPKPATKPKSRRGTASVSGVSVPTHGSFASTGPTLSAANPYGLQILTHHVSSPAEAPASAFSNSALARSLSTSAKSGTIDFGNRVAFPDSFISVSKNHASAQTPPSSTPFFPLARSGTDDNHLDHTGSIDETRSANLSPHTIDTNPGLTDNDDDDVSSPCSPSSSNSASDNEDNDDDASGSGSDVAVHQHDAEHPHREDHSMPDVLAEAVGGPERGKRGGGAAGTVVRLKGLGKVG